MRLDEAARARCEQRRQVGEIMLAGLSPEDRKARIKLAIERCEKREAVFTEAEDGISLEGFQ